MGLSDLYDDFGSRKPKPVRSKANSLSDAEIEDLKLTAFEQGFAAGWEDAVKAHADGKAEQNGEILEALRDSGFTVAEARRGLIDALAPLYTEMSTKLLPSLARAGLALHVSEQLRQMTAASLDQPVELEITKAAAARLEDVFGDELPADLTIVEIEDNEMLTARLRVGHQEREIDMSRLVTEIEEAFGAALHAIKQEMPHG